MRSRRVRDCCARLVATLAGLVDTPESGRPTRKRGVSSGCELWTLASRGGSAASSSLRWAVNERRVSRSHLTLEREGDGPAGAISDAVLGASSLISAYFGSPVGPAGARIRARIIQIGCIPCALAAVFGTIAGDS